MVFKNIELSADKVNIIVAHTDKDRFIAYNNDLPWKRLLKGDMKFINLLIRSKPNVALIVGRCTYETLPKYKNLKVIVVSSQDIVGVNTFRSFNDAVEYCNKEGMIKVAFGGVRIYEDAMKHPFVLYSTVVKQDSLIWDRVIPNFGVNLKNITKEVENYLSSNNIEKSWKINEFGFEENRLNYMFYYGENV